MFRVLKFIQIVFSLFLNFSTSAFWHGHKGGWWEERRPRSIISGHAMLTRGGGACYAVRSRQWTMVPGNYCVSYFSSSCIFPGELSGGPTKQAACTSLGRRAYHRAYHADRSKAGLYTSHYYEVLIILDSTMPFGQFRWRQRHIILWENFFPGCKLLDVSVRWGRLDAGGSVVGKEPKPEGEIVHCNV